MEAATIALLVLLSPSDAASEAASALEAAVHQSLGDVSIATVVDEPTARKAWLDGNGDFRAKYVAKIRWLDPSHSRIEVSWAQAALVILRDVTFSRKDSRFERGRAMGLVLVSILRTIPESGGPVVGEFGEIGAIAVCERANASNWAVGPGLVYSWQLPRSIQIQPFTTMQWGQLQSYWSLTFGLGALYEPLRSADGRWGLGTRLAVEIGRESAEHLVTTAHTSTSGGGEDDGQSKTTTTTTSNQTVSLWSPAIAGEIQGRLTIGSRFSVVLSLGVRWLAHSLSFTEKTSSTHYSTFRPGVGVGVGLAL